MHNHHPYRPHNIFNMDETGHRIGTTQSRRCLVIRDRSEKKGKGKKATKATSGRQEWVTTIECVSAAGQALPPLIVFKATGSFNTAGYQRILRYEVGGGRRQTPAGRTILSLMTGSSVYSSHAPPPPQPP